MDVWWIAGFCHYLETDGILLSIHHTILVICLVSYLKQLNCTSCFPICNILWDMTSINFSYIKAVILCSKSGRSLVNMKPIMWLELNQIEIWLDLWVKCASDCLTLFLVKCCNFMYCSELNKLNYGKMKSYGFFQDQNVSQCRIAVHD